MKVLVKGVNPATKPFKLICGTCATIVELTRAELNGGNDPREPYERYVRCLECGAYISDSEDRRALAERTYQAHIAHVDVGDPRR